MVGDRDINTLIEELRREIKALQKDFYGNPQIRQAGVHDRLVDLEERLDNLRTTYDQEKIELTYVNGLEARLDGLDLKLATTFVYLKGIAGGIAAIVFPLIIAGILFAFRILGGGG